jgi:hypothetical protein
LDIQSKTLNTIEERKSLFQKHPYDLISAYNREIETKKEYNGRQLLELLQNADDEKSDEVMIKILLIKPKIRFNVLKLI